MIVSVKTQMLAVSPQDCLIDLIDYLLLPIDN